MTTLVSQDEQPISRTYQYRKVMKPMLERKRRARINRCLDELKELLVGALQAEGESVSRLEKADVLELTVRHLHKLRRLQQLNENSASERFKVGFITCTNEVSKYMTTLSAGGGNGQQGSSGVDLSISARLLSHLDHCIHQIEKNTTTTAVRPIPGPGSPSIILANALVSPANQHHLQHQHHQQHLAQMHANTSPVAPHLNILTNYTPPTSPASSPSNKLVYHSSPYQQQQSISPAPAPAHMQQTPLSLCLKQTNGMKLDLATAMGMGMTDEPFDLSSGVVWRPW